MAYMQKDEEIEEVVENKIKKNTSKYGFKSKTPYHRILILSNYQSTYYNEYIFRPYINLPLPHGSDLQKNRPTGNKGDR